MTEVLNLQALRGIEGINNGDLYYAKGHTNTGDGGGGVFMWRTGDQFKTTNPPPIVSPGIYSVDNNGTIIQPIIGGNPNDTGRWVRQYEGFINVLWFGAFGVGNYYNSEIQLAIDFAKLNASDTSNLKGSTVYIPNGSYILSNIMLKSGVTLFGESIANTIIYVNQIIDSQYLFEIEIGRVRINISNLNVVGYEPSTGIITNKGCFLFEAKPSIPNPITGQIADGGLWNSTIKNINITKFNGNGIYLKGGAGSTSLIPNQFNVFENVRVFKNNDEKFTLFSNALKMTGQNGQHTFINCQFDGYAYYKTVQNKKIGYYDNWYNVEILNDGYLTSGVISFINCSFQQSDYGVGINYAENITFDNCWFEELGVAITINGDIDRSKSINILNSRFANAAGFGSLAVAPDNIKDETSCISVRNSVVNIYNNYVTASVPNNVFPTSSFVLGFPANNGINCYNNTFRDNNKKLSKTFGIMQTIDVVGNEIDCKSNKLIFVNNSKNIISNIQSAINAGEILMIRASGDSIIFDKTGNIFFLTTNTSQTFTLLNGEIASFVKIDIGTDNETYQLLYFTKTID